MESGASDGITMVARMLRIWAAAATPWAWLPEENATTPPPRAAIGIDESLLKAPRNLNEPVRWRFSSLRCNVHGNWSRRASAGIVGVRTMASAMRDRAMLMSARLGM